MAFTYDIRDSIERYLWGNERLRLWMDLESDMVLMLDQKGNVIETWHGRSRR